MNISMLRTRWAAIGAAIAVTIGAGGIGISYATSPAGAVAYVPITPCRLADTRPAPDTVGPRNTPIVAGSNLTVLAHGENGNCKAATGNAIPATATGLQLNVTGIGATSPTFVTVWATGAAQPVTSNLNLVPGAAPTPNAVTTGLSGDGRFDIANGIGSVNVIVDVVGYYTDHNHDDRYYTKAEVDARFAQTVDLQIGVGDFAADADTANWTNGCIRQDAAPNEVRAGVHVPRGATITSITGFFADGTGESELLLYRTTTSNQSIGSVTSGAAGGLVNRTANLTAPEVVGENEYFVLEFDAPDGTHQLCGASIRYTINGVGASVAEIADAGGSPTGQD
jgi:hypothetical protein